MPKIVGLALQLLAACGLLYGLALLILIRFQRRFLFQVYSFAWPQPIPDSFKKAHFVLTTADGEKLDAMWLPAKAPDCATLLYLHGNATSLNSRTSRLQALTALNFSVLAFDWRGYGKSTGTPSQQGLQLDAQAALDWLRERTDLSRVVVLAESIGTGVAVELAAKNKVGALVLEAPFYSAVDVAKMYLPIFPVRALMLDQFRSDLWIGRIRTKLLVQHGRRDHTVPFRFGERLYKLAPHPKRLIAYPTGGHDDLPERHNSYQDLKKFVVESFATDQDLRGRDE